MTGVLLIAGVAGFAARRVARSRPAHIGLASPSPPRRAAFGRGPSLAHVETGGSAGEPILSAVRFGDLPSDEAITFTPAGTHHRPERA